MLVISTAAAWPGAADPADSQVEHGEYMFHVAGCATCHTDEAHRGKPLAGGRTLKTAFGVFYPPNITPDPTYGIGGWSDEDFIRALREGVGRDGRDLYPAFPYTSYTRLTDDDIRAIKAYLFTLKPVAQPNKPHELPWYLSFRPLVKIWKYLYFTPGRYRPRTDKSERWNRGAYLASAAAHCGECHTPRNRLGGFEKAFCYAGTRNGPDESVVPNITPDKKTGIGRWRESEIAYYLETGMDPDGDFAGDLMADVIDGSTRYLTKADREAIAHYVHTLPAIPHELKRSKKKGKNKRRDTFEY